LQGRDGFAGRWTLRRDITDFLTGQPGILHGTAALTHLGASGLTYAEAGALQMGAGRSLQATRRYVWQFDAQGVAVQFEDGAPFHRFVPGLSGPGSDHPCGTDLYRVRYDFDAWPAAWGAVWRVTGPRKDYEMTSLYRR
jgi:hypothetical protein